MLESYKWIGMGWDGWDGRKSLKALILRAPLCGANNGKIMNSFNLFFFFCLGLDYSIATFVVLLTDLFVT